MADKSDRFSLNGFNIQKEFSGLHARRPENLNTYFDTKVLAVPPTFVSILTVNIINSGSNYSNNMGIRFPTPQHPNGTRATGDVYLNLTKNCFSIASAGSGYVVGDVFGVFDPNLNNTIVGIINIISVNGSGGITNFDFISYHPIKSGGNVCVVDLSNGSGTNGSITVRAESGYTINSIDMTNYGSGYQTYHRTTGATISHDIYLYTMDNNSYDDNSSGNGAQFTPSFNAIVKLYAKSDPRSRSYHEDKNKDSVLSTDADINYYYLIKNYSLSDPTR
jgi:hypothetical protein